MKTCPFCAEEVQDAAVVCKHCGRDLPKATAVAPTPSSEPSQTPVAGKAKSHTGRNVMLVIGGLVLFAIIRSALMSPSATPTTSSTGDDPKDYVAYHRIITGTDQPCDEVTRTFIAGTDSRNGTMFISVQCADGHRYQLSGSREPGSTKVLSCDVLERVTKTHCFEKLN